MIRCPGCREVVPDCACRSLAVVKLLALLVAGMFYVACPAEVRAQCVPGSYCVSESAIRQCDAAEAALPEARLQLRVASQRATVATGDALTLSRALDSQSALVSDLRTALREERRRLPAWTWTLVGAGGVLVLEVVAVVVVVLLAN